MTILRALILFLKGGKEAAGGKARRRQDGAAKQARRIAQLEANEELSKGEIDRYWWRRTLNSITESPGHFVRLLGFKLLLFWKTKIWEKGRLTFGCAIGVFPGKRLSLPSPPLFSTGSLWWEHNPMRSWKPS